MAASYNFKIIDDDGVILVASANALGAHNGWSEAPISEWLVEAMQAREMVCLGTGRSSGEAGLVRVLVQLAHRPEAESTMRALPQLGWRTFPPLRLRLAMNDRLLVLPPSRLAQAHRDGDEFVAADRSGGTIALGVGLYDVFLGQLPEPDESADDAGELADRSVWFILAPALTNAPNLVDEIWGTTPLDPH